MRTELATSREGGSATSEAPGAGAAAAGAAAEGAASGAWLFGLDGTPKSAVRVGTGWATGVGVADEVPPVGPGCFVGDGVALAVGFGVGFEVGDGVGVGVPDGSGVGVGVGVTEGAGDGVVEGASDGEGSADDAGGDGLGSGETVAGTISAMVVAATSRRGCGLACATAVLAGKPADSANPASVEHASAVAPPAVMTPRAKRTLWLARRAWPLPALTDIRPPSLDHPDIQYEQLSNCYILREYRHAFASATRRWSIACQLWN